MIVITDIVWASTILLIPIYVLLSSVLTSSHTKSKWSSKKHSVLIMQYPVQVFRRTCICYCNKYFFSPIYLSYLYTYMCTHLTWSSNLLRYRHVWLISTYFLISTCFLLVVKYRLISTWPIKMTVVVFTVRSRLFHALHNLPTYFG